MTSLPDRVVSAIRKHAMVPPGGRVLVAVSAGPDSVGLLHLLCELGRRKIVTVAGIVHLNHSLREAAAADEEFCRRLACSLGLPFMMERADVRALALQWRTSLEDAGRRARYGFFGRAVTDASADVVATGHTKDDQAETYLLQLIRGAGPKGLSSISPRSGHICRPLLEVGRRDVREWLDARGTRFRDDESNADPAFTRNRVRHDLIPLLQREFSPGIVEVLARGAAIARADEDRLQAEAIEVVGSVVLPPESTGRRQGEGWEHGLRAGADEVWLDAAALRSLHPAIGARVARMALARLGSGRYIGFDHVERLLVMAQGQAASPVSLPGQRALRLGEQILLRRAAPVPFENSFRVSLSIPGEVLLEAQGWILSTAWPGDVDPVVRAAGRRQLAVAVREDRVEGPLAVRSRLRGDRFAPAGMGGRSRKLQDVFVDRKVPRDSRDSVPIVVDRHDRIVWVVGESEAEGFRVTTPSQGVLFLVARRLGGLG